MSRISNFCCLVKNCDLFDLGYNGPAYTWTNKRFTTNPTFECLDHCLANIEWCTQFPTADVYHLPMMRSDHAPIFMVLQSNRAKEKRLFRFENFWLAENDFKQIVKQSWNLSRNTYFQRKLQYLATDLKVWRRTKPKLSDSQQVIEDQLLLLHSKPPHQQNFPIQKELMHQHQEILAK
jgi:hypothetical protein